VPPNDVPRLTADAVEQMGRLLLPAMRVAVRAELDQLRTELLGAITAQSAASDARMAAVEKRLGDLERTRSRVFAGIGVLSSAVTLAATWGFQIVKAKWFGK